MLHTGWSSTRCRSCGHGKDRWKHSSQPFWYALQVTHIAAATRDPSPVTGTKSQATMTNGINRLPHGYLYCSSHWTGMSASGLHPCCHHQGCLLEVTHYAKCTKQELELTVSGWSQHTNTLVQWSHASVGLAQAGPNNGTLLTTRSP